MIKTAKGLQERIDRTLGLQSTLFVINTSSSDEKSFSGTLIYTSPTGVTLFTIDICSMGDDQDWQFRGHSSAVPELWTVLCRIHE